MEKEDVNKPHTTPQRMLRKVVRVFPVKAGVVVVGALQEYLIEDEGLDKL